MWETEVGMWKVEEGTRNLHGAEGMAHGVRKEVKKEFA